MCGRYTLTRQERLAEELEAALDDAPQSEWWKPRFNVAPTQPAPVVILRDGGRHLAMMRWGLVPHWAGKGSKPPLMINARVESVQDKPMFRDALQRHRCLVPADGFFEWKREGTGKAASKQAMYMHRRGKELFAFAGLWARSRTDAGEVLSFTIVTGPPNELVAPIHDRMPIVLDPSTYAAWLDPTLDANGARELLGVPPVDDWIAEPVSPRVNSAANDDADCIAPVTADGPVQGDLFSR
jgi:putative SOS response-associated peptidase YedK